MTNTARKRKGHICSIHLRIDGAPYFGGAVELDTSTDYTENRQNVGVCRCGRGWEVTANGSGQLIAHPFNIRTQRRIEDARVTKL